MQHKQLRGHTPSRLYKDAERYEVIKSNSAVLLLVKALSNNGQISHFSTCNKIKRMAGIRSPLIGLSNTSKLNILLNAAHDSWHNMFYGK